MCQSAMSHWIKWAEAALNCCYRFIYIFYLFFRMHTPWWHCWTLWKNIECNLMIIKLMSLLTHLKVVYSASLINTLQAKIFVSFFYQGQGLWWWSGPMRVLINSPLEQMTVLHYLPQPWRLWPYWFLELWFHLIASGRLPVTEEGKKAGMRGVFLWLTAVSQWNDIHPLKGSSGGDLPFLPYLSFIYRLSVSFSGYLLFWLSILHALSSDP